MQIEQNFVLRGIAKLWVGFRIGATPDPLTLPRVLLNHVVHTTFSLKQRPNNGSWSVTLALWSHEWPFDCLLLFSTRQLYPNSLPRSAHSSYAYTKIFIGFALCLMPKMCPAYRRPYSLTTCGNFLLEQVISSNYNCGRSDSVVACHTAPCTWWANFFQ